MPSDPAPISFPASNQFIGADGSWSTIPVNIGTPPQTVQLLVSTQQQATWAVSPKGCGGDGDGDNCTTARGGAFDPGTSSTWFRKDTYQLKEALNLGYSGNEQNGTYGFDKVAVSTGGSQFSVDHQVVAAITTRKFYLGSLGLAPQVVNFSDASDTAPSFISSLKDQNLIPSLSYGYTAGAYYRSKGGAASLTIGGYDSAKFQKNDLQFGLGNNPDRTLSTGLRGISYKDSNGEKSLLSEGIITAIDSTVPYLWLPDSSCKMFESALGIQMDPIKNLYIVNDTTHDALIKSNPSFTFSVANINSQGGAVNITFPYAAFDLNMTAPLAKNFTRYFPLQRAPDDQSATLGRAFMQEAYIISNFETSTFSISQALHDGAPSSIIPIKANANGTTSSAPTGSGGKAKKSGGIGTGAIAGLAIAIAIVGIIVAVAFWFFYRRRKRRNANLVAQTHLPPVEIKEPIETARTSHDDPEPKKFADNIQVTQLEEPMTPPMSEMQGSHGYDAAGPSSQAPVELSAHRLSGIEMGGHDWGNRHELHSPGLSALRSELSTPEPIMPSQELPTPDPSAELPSPQMRPISPRMGSTDSGASIESEQIHGLGLHSRNPSDDSTAQRPISFARRETEDSIESPILGRLSSGGATTTTDLETPTTPVGATSTARNFGSVNKRPVHLRQDSDTWQTRLQSQTDEQPATSRFSTAEKEKKDSEPSIVSPLLPETPVFRKPVPSRTVSEETAPLVEENEDDGHAAAAAAKVKDEKAKQ